MKAFLQKKLWLFYLPLSILFSELVLKLWCFRALTVRGTVFTLLFSLAAGTLLTLLCSLGGGRFCRVSMSVWLVLLFLLYGTQAVYYHIFKTFVTLFSIGQAGEVIGNFWKQALEGIFQTLPELLVLALPAALWLLFGRRLEPAQPGKRLRLSLLAVFLLLQLGTTAAVLGSDEGVMSAAYLYTKSYVPELSIRYFGAVTNFLQDIRWTAWPDVDTPELIAAQTPTPSPAATPATPAPAPAATAAPDPTELPEETPAPTPEPDTGPNVWEIDFDALIAGETDAVLRSMHEYFSQVEPTNKNEYTGLFAGKNLVWIVGESFSTLALDEEHTPTLWKLAHEGFVFENFYNPVWGVSTSDGEYVTLNSLMPKSGVWSFSRSSGNYMAFSFAHLMSPLGYRCIAYHNHSYTYYDRNLSHPNMGYEFKAVGHGLDMEPTWPESDLEMIDETTADYIGQGPFSLYYLTVSGHMNYTFSGNYMAWKHQEEVADLPYSEQARAYIACHMELDQAMALLIERLDEAGILEDTVIVLSGDHYPYGLEQSAMEELYGGKIEKNFELYHSTLILWCAAMEEPVTVSKACSSMDIMPTLANLFGLSYDSRLIMGRDILSDAPALVVFVNRSYITDLGRYNASTDTFTAAEGVEWPAGGQEAYARTMLQRVNDMFYYSAKILDLDYYAKVLNHS